MVLAIRQSLWVSVAIAFLLTSLAIRSARADECGEIIAGWVDWPPYQYLAGGRAPDDPSGLDIDAVAAVFSALGCNIRYVNRPWKRMFREMELGQIHLLSGISQTAERSAKFDFSDAYRSEEVALFVRAADSGRYGFQSLEEMFETGFRLGVPRGSYLGADFDRLRRAGKYNKQIFERVGGESLMMIRKGRLDGFIIDYQTGLARIADEALEADIVAYEAIRYGIGEIHFMLQKGRLSSGQMDRLNRIIGDYRKSSHGPS